MSYFNKIKLTGNQSGFGDQIQVPLSPILAMSFEYNMVDNTEFWTLTETAGGTASQSAAQAVMNSSTTANSVGAMRSVRPCRYHAGFGGQVRFTAKFSAAAASCTQAIGIFDAVGSTAKFKNGYGVGYNGTTFTLLHYRNDSTQSVALTAADDPLDGTGASGMTFSPTAYNIWKIDYAYLGIGDIVYSIYYPTRKEFVEVHRIKTANTGTVPHSYMPNYYLWGYVDNGATTSDVTVSTSSMAYFLAGPHANTENQQPNQSYYTSAGSITTETQLFSIRNKSTYTSLTNFIDIVLENMTANYEATANARGIIKLVVNPTLDGSASWTDVNATDSVVEYDTAQTTVSAEGKVIFIAYTAGQFDRIDSVDLTGARTMISPGDEVACLVQSTQSATFSVFLRWRELF